MLLLLIDTTIYKLIPDLILYLIQKIAVLFSFFIHILVFVTIVQSTPAKDIIITSTCNALIDRYSNYTARVESVDGCTSAFVNFTDTPSAQCEGINYLWAQLAYNLIMIHMLIN